MKRTHLFLLVAAMALALNGCSAKDAKSETSTSSEEMNRLQVKSQDDAVRIALQELKTTTNPSIESVKLITKDGKQVWEVVLRDRTGLKLGTTVLIDASSGKVVDIISEVKG
ncbi:PepSY domain-containing protein [Paenibacillus sp. Soil522]|uniref:PepSY domain-containing protein n=1 Tax=Paenibacillus sp. Soil522 TaxID=1736388 RepID=UPI0006FF9670|nr:PepSY domain-containing protein [Paenibacillus sp. Soil522]KRE40900.1 hypothetical protein ASG81_16800 [Paenibacillus sp. Soil522]